MLASVAIGLGFAATIVLDIMLIPPYGGLGAALASTLAYTAGGIAVAVIFTRALGGRLARPGPAGHAMLAWLCADTSSYAAGRDGATAGALPERSRPSRRPCRARSRRETPAKTPAIRGSSVARLVAGFATLATAAATAPAA